MPHLLDTENIDNAMLENYFIILLLGLRKDTKTLFVAKSWRLLKRKSWSELEQSLTDTQF